MAKITIKLENGAYNYYEDSKLVKSNLSVRKVVRKNGDVVGDIILPENSYGKKTISTTRFNETVTEFDLSDVTVRTAGNSTKSAPKSKIDLNEHYTDEERAKVEKLQAQIDKINEAVIKRAEQKRAEQALMESAMGLSIEQLETIMAAKKAEVKA